MGIAEAFDSLTIIAVSFLVWSYLLKSHSRTTSGQSESAGDGPANPRNGDDDYVARNDDDSTTGHHN